MQNIILLFVHLICAVTIALAQCTPGSAYQGGVAPALGGSTTMTTCAYAGEYQTVTDVVSGYDYVLTYTGGTGNYITVWDAAWTAVAWGVSPLSWTATGSGTYYSQANLDGFCATDFTCRTAVWTNLGLDFDSEIIVENNEYSSIPLAQQTLLGAECTIQNLGSPPISLVSVTVTVYDGNMSSVFSETTSGVNLSGLNSAIFTTSGYQPAIPDNYTTEYVINQAELDPNLSNNSETRQVTISESIYARDIESWNTSVSDTCASIYTLSVGDDLSSLMMYGNVEEGSTLKLALYTTTAGGLPLNEIASGITVSQSDGFQWFNVYLSGGPIFLSPGTYAVVFEPDQNFTQYIAWASDILTENKSFVKNFPSFFPNSGWQDLSQADFTAKLRAVFGCEYLPTFASIQETGCEANYVAPSGAVYTSSGTYLDVIPNAAGCDSVITIDLTMVTIPTSIMSFGTPNLLASCWSCGYQWVDCNNNYSQISGATNQEFTATTSGSYAVILSGGGCSDTSNCVTVSYADMIELSENDAELIKIIDMQGRVTNFKPNIPLLYLYSDGTVRRVVKIEH